MRHLISRISFTTRLVLAAVAVTITMVAIDYVTLLDLPERVAADSVEVALRENITSFNTALREEKAELGEQTDELLNHDAVIEAIRNNDPDGIEAALIARGTIDVKAAILPPGEFDGSSLAVVFSQRTLAFRGIGSRTVVFYRGLNAKVLDTAAADAGGNVSFAVERDGVYIARSGAFPRDIESRDINPQGDGTAGNLEPITVDGEHLHIYSRELAQTDNYDLHALSTQALEDEALSVTRGDVRIAIAGMTLATLAGTLLIAIFTSRSVRRFAGRVRELADGDYGRTLPVHGRDGFADLADSVNRLSSELDERLSQLEEAAGAFRRTLETLEEGICTWSEAGTITYWNRGAEQLTGIARERLDPSDPLIAFLDAERAPGTRRVTLPVRRSGAGLVVDLVVTVMPGGGVLQTFRDTTMADVLQQTQRNFMATAAHELRTPITTILGFADTLTNPDMDLTPAQREEFLGIIREQSHQLQEISDAFFTSHQLANERVEVSLAKVTLEHVARSSVERATEALPDYADQLGDIQFDVPPNLHVLADRRALMGVISVLVENAAKYGRKPITISAERHGGTIALHVRDEGPGIDPYHQERVFDPFYRIDVDMRSGIGGAGLGLFTARKLIEAMHGVIRIRSAPGMGATFIVELPATQDSDLPGDSERALRLVI
ncbi:MAG: sensory box histidine kinase similar to PhoR [Thermoleophilia bacterium]|nr:sensory box histidine kinase similar to PhoR [Thermoleophilia bacterium]